MEKKCIDGQAVELIVGFQQACMNYARALPAKISLGDVMVSKQQFAGWHVLCSGWDRHQIQYGDLPAPHAASTFFDGLVTPAYTHAWKANSTLFLTTTATSASHTYRPSSRARHSQKVPGG